MRCDCLSFAEHKNYAMRLFQLYTTHQLCGAIVSDRHSPKAIATGCADPSHKYTTLWEEFIDLWEA